MVFKSEPVGDFSTVYPLYSLKQESGRALEITRAIHSVWERIQSIYKDPAEAQVITTLLRNTLEGYFSCKLPIPVPGKYEHVEPYLEIIFRDAIASGILPRQLPTDESWEKILLLEKMLQSQIKKSLRNSKHS